MLSNKYGMSRGEARAAHGRLEALGSAEGIVYDFDAGHPANTFDAHRLLHLAQESGLGDAGQERLFAAYFTEGRRIDDQATLAELAAEIGLDEGAARELLAGDAYAADVEADIREAQKLGLGGVPAFVIDRHYLVSGAQESALILSALGDAWEARSVL
jgi:predicted DsbA family dithiol-disulfide isomerase